MAIDNGNGEEQREDLEEVEVGRGFGRVVGKVPPGRRVYPRSVSERGYMRQALPVIYQEYDFGMRFVGAFERTLDPIIALLDSLDSHIDPDFAPPDILELLGAWLGIQLDESQPIEHHRRVVKRASELWRRRGTARGLDLALKLSFPELTIHVEDPGRAVWSREGELVTAEQPVFDVTCEQPVTVAEETAIRRRIEGFKPAHAGFRLNVTTVETEE